MTAFAVSALMLMLSVPSARAAPAKIFWQASGSLFAIDAGLHTPFETLATSLGYNKNDFLGPVLSQDETELFWMSSNIRSPNDPASINTFHRHNIASGQTQRVGFGCHAGLAGFDPCIFKSSGSVPTGALAHDADNDRLLCYLNSGKLLGVALSGTAKDEEPETLETFSKSEHEFSGPMHWFENEWWVVDLKVGIVSIEPNSWNVTTRVEVTHAFYLTGFAVRKSTRQLVYTKAAPDSRITKGMWRYDLDTDTEELLERWLPADSYYGVAIHESLGWVHTIMSIPYTLDSNFLVRRPHLRTDHRGRIDANAEAHAEDRRDTGQRWMVMTQGDLAALDPVPVPDAAGEGGRGYHSLGRSQDGWFHDYYSSDFSQYTARKLIDSVSIITSPELDREVGWAYYVNHYRIIRRAYQTDNREEILWDTLDPTKNAGKTQMIHQFEDKFSFGMSAGFDERRKVFYYIGFQPRLEALNSWVPYLALYAFQPGVDVSPWLRYVFIDDGQADWQGGRLVFIEGETPEEDYFLAPNFDEGVWKISGIGSFDGELTKSLLFPRSGTGPNQLSYGCVVVGDKVYYPEDDFLYELDLNNLPPSGQYKEIASVFHRPPPTTTSTTYEAYGVVYNQPTNTLTLSHRTGLGDNYLSLFDIESGEFIGPPFPLAQEDPEGGTVPRASSFLKYLTVHPGDFDVQTIGNAQMPPPGGEESQTPGPAPTMDSDMSQSNTPSMSVTDADTDVDGATPSDGESASEQGQCQNDDDCPGEDSVCKSDLTCLLADGFCFKDEDCDGDSAICKSDNTCVAANVGDEPIAGSASVQQSLSLAAVVSFFTFFAL